MTKMNRRSFLKLLPAIPLLKMTWPHITMTSAGQIQNGDAPNILVLVFDTLSARHMSLHGYSRETTPNIARFAERSTVFHQHTASGNFTSPGTASMLTGTYPWSHRAIHIHGMMREEFAQKNIFKLLPDTYYKAAYTHNLLVMSLLHQCQGEIDEFVPTRALCLVDDQFSDRLFYNDYTPAFWAESTALRPGATPPGTLFLSLLDKLNQLKDTRPIEAELRQRYPRGIPNLHSLLFLLEDAIDWIQAQVTSMPQPYLGYFHLLPPHEPYTTRRDFIDRFADEWQPIEKEKSFGSQSTSQRELNRERRHYDEYLAFADAEFGRLLDNLEQAGTLDNTYLILTSDHGELFERGIRGHVTLTLWDPLTHVPLLISKPGQTERVDVFTRTSAVDLLPTLLHLTAQPIPDWAEGVILPTFTDGQPDNDRTIYTVEAKSNPKHAPLNQASIGIFKNGRKLVRYFGHTEEDIFGMYDVENDPEELTDIYTVDKASARALEEEMRAKIDEVNEPFQR